MIRRLLGGLVPAVLLTPCAWTAPDPWLAWSLATAALACILIPLLDHPATAASPAKPPQADTHPFTGAREAAPVATEDARR